MGKRASTVFKSHVKGKNVITPNTLGYGFIGKQWVYEVTEGTGFLNEAMFGVTVVNAKTGELNRDMGQLCDTRELAEQWVEAMKEEYQG